LAAYVASMRLTDILQFVSAAFSLAAATFFPVLILGIFWRRANGAGASAGMLVGMLTCAYYMVTNHPALREFFGVSRPLADCRWWDIDPMAAGVFGLPAGLLAAVVVSWITPPPAQALQAAVDRMRFPGPDEAR
jgi:cation/acetate symporter